MQERQQVVLLQRLEHVELATRQQRADDLERGILSRGSYQRDDATLDGTKQRVLLRLREAVYLVNEQDGRCLVEEAALLRLLYHVADVLHATRHRRQRIERCLQSVGDNLGQRRLANARRPPQDERRDASRVDHATQDSPLTYQMFLPDVVIERAGAQSFS